jgi:hypothetical protein
MAAINLPGQTELPIVVDHKRCTILKDSPVRYAANTMDIEVFNNPAGIQLAKLLRDYDNRPSSETWRKIQQLAAEILK